MNQGKNKHYDLIIVGSGPGGATVAKEMTLKNKQVLLLELGNYSSIRGSKLQALSMASIPGRSLMLTQDFLSVVRGITTGGSSIFYYATAFEPPHNIFSDYGIDLADDIEQLKKELPISPLSDSLIGPGARRLMESAQDLGYDWQKLPKFIYQDKCLKGCWKCSYGCPHGAKWNARMYVEEAIQQGLTLKTNAKVKRVMIDKGKAVGVEYRKFGKSHQAFADNTIIAAGGIGTPLILRASGLQNVGNDFFFDPLLCVMGTIPESIGGCEIPMAGGVHMEEDGYLMTDMISPQMLYMGLTAQVFRLHKLLSHSNTLQIMVKAKDNLGGFIGKKGGVHKRLSSNDRQKLMQGYEHAKEILKKAGAKDIFKSWYLGAHPGGTAKINDIVDNNLKTQFDNLYVCDCSVIPESWGLPPTLTLLAFGRRLSRHLADHSV